MVRYWFEFDFNNFTDEPFGTRMGCGITGYNYEDVLDILKQKVFVTKELPTIIRAVENIDISTLDEGHVLPNMVSPLSRGVWFPIGFQ
jgi:hypothetical protein